MCRIVFALAHAHSEHKKEKVEKKTKMRLKRVSFALENLFRCLFICCGFVLFLLLFFLFLFFQLLIVFNERTYIRLDTILRMRVCRTHLQKKKKKKKKKKKEEKEAK